MSCRVRRSLWAKEVKRLDDNKCAFCGSTERLESHHIHPKALYPDEANDLENGVTLCHKCHYAAHGGNYYRNSTTMQGLQHITDTKTENMLSFLQDYYDTHIVVELPHDQMNRVKAAAKKMGISAEQFLDQVTDMIIEKERV